MPAADYTGMVSSTGVKQRGPSGAPIWTTPTIDAQRSQIYVTTGENTSHPTTGTSGAVIALDLETGEELWVFRHSPTTCGTSAAAQRSSFIILDDANSVDFDFGGPAILVDIGDRELLVAGRSLVISGRWIRTQVPWSGTSELAKALPWVGTTGALQTLSGLS